MVETLSGERMRYDELPCRARELIDAIREHHKMNNVGRPRNGFHTNGNSSELKSKYSELIELMRDAKPEGVTHFRIARSGDVVFVHNSRLYGQSFKRLWSLHLPLC